MMEFRPCIDLHEGKVKQIVGSSLTDDCSSVKTNFVSPYTPEYYARMYFEDHLTGGHVIMLGRNNTASAKAALSAFPGGLQIGGGINNDNAQEWLDCGAAKVILTSFIFSGGELNLDNLSEIFRIVGRDRLVLDLSCRFFNGEYFIVTDRWQKYTSIKVDADILNFLSQYCSEYLIHAVDVEGKQAGIDVKLLEIIGRHSPIDAVYAGGICSFNDIDTIWQKGQGRVSFTIGSALDIFGGNLSYREVINYTKYLNKH
jgi:phosphoribosylformimino-5-aminoimidazole carboxamide ribotide isomerase